MNPPDIQLPWPESTPVVLLFMALGWFMAFVVRRSRILTTVAFMGIAFLVVQHPWVLIYGWNRSLFFWWLIGFVISVSRNFTRPQWNGGGLESLWRLRGLIVLPFRILFVLLPVLLIRLGFWLRNTIPLLTTPDGWTILFRGLAAWLYYLLPRQIRQEWERNASPPKGTPDSQSASRTRQQPKAKSHSQSRSSGDFWEEARRRAQREKDDRAAAKAQQDPPRPKKERQKTRSSAGTRDSGRTRSKGASQTTGGRGSQSNSRAKPKSRSSSTSSSSAPPPKSQPPPPRPQPSTGSKSDPLPGTIDYLKAHRTEFEGEDWPFDPHEGTITSGGSAMSILKVDATTSKVDIKKAYRQLAKVYMPFTLPYRPICVQKHAAEIMTALNGAKDRLL